MKTAVIIEARMESSRLPGKVMLPIYNKPAIGHLIERVKNVRNIDEIIVATTVNKLDDELCEYLEKNNIKYFRGSEDDVLDRVVKTAIHYNIDTVVEITGDCQLTDFRYIDEVIEFYNKNQYDLVSNTYPNRNLPIGLDVFVISTKLLSSVNKNDKDPMTHEHVCYGIFSKPEKYKLGFYQNNKEINYPHYHWTLDTIDDYKFLKRVYSELYPIKKNFVTEDILNLLKAKKEIVKINENVQQKTLEDKVYNVAIIGTGKISFEFDDPNSTTSKSHYGAIKQNPYLNLVAICDISKLKVEKIKKKYNLKSNIYTNYKQMLKDEKIDILIVSTPKEARTIEMAKIIKKSSVKVVLIEKPISITLNNSLEFIRQLKDKNIYINYTREFMPEYEILKLILETKEIQFINAVYSKGYINNGSHLIDLFSYFFGIPNNIVINESKKSYLNDKTYNFDIFYNNFKVNVNALDYELYNHIEVDIFTTDGRIRIIDSLGIIEYYEINEDKVYNGYKRLKLNRLQTIDRENIFKRVYAKILSNLQAPNSFIQDINRIEKIQEYIYMER